MDYLHWLPFVILLIAPPLANAQKKPVNVIVVLADDLGYGDLGCYGHPTIETPNLDRMALEGMKFTPFIPAPMCARQVAPRC